MRVAVTGATGYVGRFVVAALQREGHKVRAWARDGSDRGGFAAPVVWCPGGLGVDGAAEALVAGVDAVVHAAFAHVPGRYRGGEGDDVEGFFRANLDGSLALIRAARRAGVARFVFLSSRAVYGARLWDRPLDERHPVTPTTHYGAYKAAVEAVLAGYGRGEGWACASLRATGVYGVGRPLTRAKWYDVVRTSLAGTPPTGVMATDRLQALGWRPRGWAGVDATVAALVEAARTR